MTTTAIPPEAILLSSSAAQNSGRRWPSGPSEPGSEPRHNPAGSPLAAAAMAGWPDPAAAPAGPTGAQVGGLLCAAAVPLAAGVALLAALGAGELAAGPAGGGTGPGGPKPPCPDRRWWLRKVGWSLGLALYYTVASPVFVAVVGPSVAGTCASRFGDYKVGTCGSRREGRRPD